MENSDFYTIRGYNRRENLQISHAMEDYLEMIYRHTGQGEYIRVNQLAFLLNVRPPSASKMAAKLKENGMVQFEPYGVIRLTPVGNEAGAYLIRRHNTLHRFFCHINHTENELEIVEKIEHYFDKRTIENIEAMLRGIGIGE